ncbi:MAG: GDSL-type esterase/lipase family protein [Pseudomonas sp.]
MTEAVAKLALGPLLLMQGLYTRWVTPKLPEAQGERLGISGQGAALRLLILGDSAAAGVGAASQDEALAGRLVSRLAADFRVSWKLLAESGLDSREVLQMLERGSAERFDVAVVSVGVNDVTSGIRATEWLAQQARLIDLLCWKFGVSQVVLSPYRRCTCFRRCRNRCAGISGAGPKASTAIGPSWCGAGVSARCWRPGFRWFPVSWRRTASILVHRSTRCGPMTPPARSADVSRPLDRVM